MVSATASKYVVNACVEMSHFVLKAPIFPDEKQGLNVSKYI